MALNASNSNSLEQLAMNGLIMKTELHQKTHSSHIYYMHVPSMRVEHSAHMSNPTEQAARQLQSSTGSKMLYHVHFIMGWGRF